MAQSSHHATHPSKETVSALSDVAFAEILAKRLASLSAEQEAANSRLGILSCLAAEVLKEDFPEPTDEEAPASSELSWEEDTEDLMDEDDDDDDDAEHTCPRFKSGERVRVPSKSSPEGWRYLHIADLTVFPPKHSPVCCTYPVLMQYKPRIVRYLDSTTLTRVDPW
ncbi:hypothetical protein GSI_06879 [Ganoderma sinense ZZ0214-1]|uniref:Uncharacterized protein n=1 Tax=Ganoderma sinense ZZ0214-1 TaxID=1077348 RepID=A0A2G8SAD7_9APHY|nr:hypothetical protein GSI_06879 [Ganoderma sinense ZZ0214-1]